MVVAYTIQIDQHDPLLIHHFDHPSQSLVSTPLNGDNFGSWRRAIVIALESENKMGFVDGLIPKPTDSTKLSLWKRNDSIVRSWLLNSVNKDIVTSVIYSSTATILWEDLNSRYRQQNGPRVFQLKKEIFSCNQGLMSVSHYFAKIKSLWEELSDFQPPHSCTCAGVKPLLEYLHFECVMSFLMGLNENYSHISGQILLRDPIPSISRVFSLMVQE
uniref:Retrotransposon Copia-like N-terminal domain-containing protein n=1 Tax=Cajanus cajan TaxID=3821 RepID=A0A151RFB2_CAJCA|nr:hypothetical protein KK1_037312 [Cajanus cajan]